MTKIENRLEKIRLFFLDDALTIYHDKTQLDKLSKPKTLSDAGLQLRSILLARIVLLLNHLRKIRAP